jgi:hypothetical protein
MPDALAQLFDSLTTLVQPWADAYSKHAALSTSVIAAHVLAMFVGGGLAIGADRAILRAAPGSAEAARAVVADFATAHALVIGSLVLTVLTGVALFLADVPTFSVSPVYWIKMASFVLLLVNGLRMRKAEGDVLTPLKGMPLHTTEMPVAFPKTAWSAVRTSAGASLFFWVLIVVQSVVLSKA